MGKRASIRRRAKELLWNASKTKPKTAPCYYCGKPLPREQSTLDHFQPPYWFKIGLRSVILLVEKEIKVMMIRSMFVFAVLCALFGCSGKAPSPTAKPVEHRPVAHAPINFHGPIWCLKWKTDGAIGFCSDRRPECDAALNIQLYEPACVRLGEAWGREVYSRIRTRSPVEPWPAWGAPAVELYGTMGSCERAGRYDDGTLGSELEKQSVASECVIVIDRPYADSLAQAEAARIAAADAVIVGRVESISSPIWCFAYGDGDAFCETSERSCQSAQSRRVNDEGLAAGPCELKTEAYGFSYTDYIYRNRSRMIFLTPARCSSMLDYVRSENRRGINRYERLTECSHLISARSSSIPRKRLNPYKG